MLLCMQFQFHLKPFLFVSKGNDLVMRLYSNDHRSYAIIRLALKYSLLTQFVEPSSLLMTSLHIVIRHISFVLRCC